MTAVEVKKCLNKIKLPILLHRAHRLMIYHQTEESWHNHTVSRTWKRTGRECLNMKLLIRAINSNLIFKYSRISDRGIAKITF